MYCLWFQMAFSAVAVVAKALTLLEAGQLSVVSFGEEVKLVHPFEEPFTDASGSRLMQQFTFAQRRTRIVQLMEHTSALFNHAKTMNSNSSAPVETAQLLLIMSDGRAVCHEGSDKVKTAVRKAREQNIFIVFVIVDNPDNKHSILDIQQPVFEAGNKVQFVKYMDNFPFPFYLILRDLSSLPSVLSDALRQWFELVTSSNR
jgi:midasin